MDGMILKGGRVVGITAVNEPKCGLLVGWFALSVQLVLACLALGSLLLKWRLEIPRRSFGVWKFDVAKQSMASLCAHALNLVLASVLSKDGDTQCAWYFLNFVVDCIFGIMIATFLLWTLEYFANRFGWEELKESGFYGSDIGNRTSSSNELNTNINTSEVDDDEYEYEYEHEYSFNINSLMSYSTNSKRKSMLRFWIIQAVSWTAITLMSKLILALPLFLGRAPLTEFAYKLFEPLADRPKSELVIVMIIVPGIMNCVQLCILDQVLKRRVNITHGSRSSVNNNTRERNFSSNRNHVGLINRTSSDEDNADIEMIDEHVDNIALDGRDYSPLIEMAEYRITSV
mmetsp:Transcript_35527/g.43926  ORF Transcript_35527/g.43926 Transcript_35527/m.43926 type:complete len:344 (+) Transcript_35527:133-1164(+)